MLLERQWLLSKKTMWNGTGVAKEMRETLLREEASVKEAVIAMDEGDDAELGAARRSKPICAGHGKRRWRTMGRCERRCGRRCRRKKHLRKMETEDGRRLQKRRNKTHSRLNQAKDRASGNSPPPPPPFKTDGDAAGKAEVELTRHGLPKI